jgi:hypothetical protein
MIRTTAKTSEPSTNSIPHIFGEAFDQYCLLMINKLRCDFNNRIFKEMAGGHRPTDGCIITTPQSSFSLDQEGLILKVLPSIAHLRLYFGSDGEYYTRTEKGYEQLDSFVLTKRIEAEILHLPLRDSNVLYEYQQRDATHYKVLAATNKFAAVLDQFYTYPISINRLLSEITVAFDSAISIVHAHNWYLEATTLDQICKDIELELCDRLYLDVSENTNFTKLKDL